MDKIGKIMVMVKDLYGSNSIGASWRTLFAESFQNMDFVLIVDDPDVYHRQARKPNGEEYYGLL